MRGSTAPAILAAIGALLCAGCGPAIYVSTPEEPAAVEAAPVIVLAAEAAPAEAPEDRWLPDGLPHDNPFALNRIWVGDYDCPQGRTDLVLRVIDVGGDRVRAIFDFHHAPTNAAGQFLVAGRYDGESGHVNLAPGAWLLHPEGYVTVGMSGHVSADGARFEGKITAAECGDFQLHAAQ
jgi:hypothetical protein